MTGGTTGKRLLTGALVTAVASAGLVALTATAASAEPPTALSPNGSSVSGIPVLTWNRPTPTAKYDVEVSSVSDFGSVIDSVNATANSQWVADKQLPTGTLYWRVRIDGSAQDWSTVAEFDRDDVAAPAITGPADGASLPQPSSPPVLSWSAVPGADSYQVQYGTDSTFTDQTTTATTEGSSYVVDLQAPGTYVWRVRGVLATGIHTEWSGHRSYEIESLAAAGLVSPPDDANQNLQDVVLDWAPVLGAAAYDLQVSTDENFNTLTASANGVVGTRWSPGGTLNNDQYNWRVRPVDNAGNRPEWGTVPTWQFRRNWPEQPALEYPTDNGTVGDPFYYQWEPVELASRYIVYVSPNASFTPAASVETCTTVHTTLTLGDTDRDDDCFPAALGHYYWKVQAVDELASVAPVTELVNAETFEFTYLPAGATFVSPAPGSTVKVPTLRWNPVSGAAQYKVTITPTAGGGGDSTITAATSFTPNELEPGTYRWDVQTIGEDGRTGFTRTPGSQPSFTLVEFDGGDPTFATPSGHHLGSSYRFPTLTWDRVTDAKTYVVRARKTGTVGWTPIGDPFGFPAGEDTTTDRLSPSDYQFYVEAYDEEGAFISQGSIGTFTIAALPVVPLNSYKAAITGNTLTGNGGVTDVCDATLPASCQNLRQTPVLGWTSPNPNVGYYELHLSRDAAHTNVVKVVEVTSTIWTDIAALADSNASTAYFWSIVPCTADGNCSTLTSADHSFNKLSRPASPISPAGGATVANDVTFTWDDYLDSLDVVDGPGDPDTGTPLDTPARTEARHYRIQTSTDPNMVAGVTTTTIDQRTFTSLADTYPEGTNYWRVQAVDGSNNQLAWSPIRSFVKQSPVPTLATPAAGVEVPGDSTVSWQPLAFASSYFLEVYKNNDMVPSTANRVVNVETNRISAVLPSLDPATGPYTWRVRREDADNRDGAWSPLRQFTVSSPAPTLEAPAPGAEVPPSDGLFSWSALDRATKYRFERRPAGTTTLTESVVTPALAYAPVVAIVGGDHEWRVVALDTAGHSLGATAWQGFAVHDTPAASTVVAISGSGAVGTPLTLSPPTWDMPDVTTTYQWYRGAAAISGQTATTYDVVTADIGKAITVRATGTRPGYKTGTSTSNAITGTAGPAITPTQPPSFTGIPAARETLTANPGTWPGSPTYSYQWFVGEAAVAKADDPTYVVRTRDAGLPVKVRVIATTAGYLPGTAYSASQTVAKLPSSLTAALEAKKIPKRGRGVILVQVDLLDLGVALGKVQVKEGSKAIANVTVKNDSGGELTIRLKKLPPGKHKLTVTYLGSSATMPSKAKKLTLIVLAK